MAVSKFTAFIKAIGESDAKTLQLFFSHSDMHNLNIVLFYDSVKLDNSGHHQQLEDLCHNLHF